MFSSICIIAAFVPAGGEADKGPPDALQNQNLVTNSSLEEPVDGAGLPPGWGSFYAEPASSYGYSIADVGRTGKKSMRIAGNGTFGVMPANRVEIDRNKRYVARGWVKMNGDASATADVKFHYYGADGRYLDQTRIGYASPTVGEWQLVTVTDRASSIPQAKFIGLAFSATGKAEVLYDDLELLAFDRDNLPKDFESEYGVTRSPQLAILDRLVGDWVTNTTIKPCLWVHNGAKSTGVDSNRWALGGQFLEGRGKNETTGEDSLFLMTFDRRRNVYCIWHFNSQGIAPKAPSIASWEPGTQKLAFAATDDENVHSVVSLALPAGDVYQWSGTWTDAKGQVLLDIEVTCTRRKQGLKKP